MKEKITDERVDEMMRTLLANAVIDEEGLEAVADSPNVWRTVQRQIAAQKETQKSPWPPANIIRRWLMIGVPVTAAAALIISLFVFRPATSAEGPNVAAEFPATKVVPGATERPELRVTPIEQLAQLPPPPDKAYARPNRLTSTNRFIRTRQKSGKPAALELTTAINKTEIKTDFIALTYARSPESGQIVRIKVPSSMMVTLGVVANVEKPSNLVDADILVGDDGLTRAIRFIRSN